MQIFICITFAKFKDTARKDKGEDPGNIFYQQSSWMKKKCRNVLDGFLNHRPLFPYMEIPLAPALQCKWKCMQSFQQMCAGGSLANTLTPVKSPAAMRVCFVGLDHFRQLKSFTTGGIWDVMRSTWDPLVEEIKTPLGTGSLATWLKYQENDLKV